MKHTIPYNMNSIFLLFRSSTIPLQKIHSLKLTYSTEKGRNPKGKDRLIAFHYTGCLIAILMMAS